MLKRKIIALVLVAIIVISGFTIYFYEKDQGKSITLGPKLFVKTYTSGDPEGNQTIQVFSVMPSIMQNISSNVNPPMNISKYNITNNPVYVELLNVSFPFNSSGVFFLSPLFINISRE